MRVSVEKRERTRESSVNDSDLSRCQLANLRNEYFPQVTVKRSGVIISDQAVDFYIEDICILFTGVFCCVTYDIPKFFNSLKINGIILFM